MLNVLKSSAVDELIEKLDKCSSEKDKSNYLLEHDEINFILDYMDELEHYAKSLEEQVEELKREREELILEIDPYKRYALNESDFH